jgi:predicted ester cyclase
MSVEENKKSCYRCFEEIWNKGDLSVIPEVISPDYIGHNVPQEYIGQEGFKNMMQTVLTGFPDIHVSVDDVFGEGDKLAIHIITTGTQTGKYGDAEPTGESMKTETLLINRYVDGKCLESTPYSGQTS